jgi:hypothetical protein
MNEKQLRWKRLVDAACLARDHRSDAAPYGFATRVVTLAYKLPHSVYTTYEGVSLKAMLYACSIAAVVLVANTSSLIGLISHDDPTTELVDLSLD